MNSRKGTYNQFLRSRKLRKLKKWRIQHPFEPRWYPDFKNNWSAITLRTYELIYKTASQRYQEILDESESITTKAFRILVGISAVIAFSTAYLEKDNLPFAYWIAITLFAICDLIMLIYLLHPTDVKIKGFRPDEIIPPHLDKPGDIPFQRHILYYSMIVLIQERIKYMIPKNKSRGRFYNWALIYTVIILGLLMYGVILSLNAPKETGRYIIFR